MDNLLLLALIALPLVTDVSDLHAMLARCCLALSRMCQWLAEIYGRLGIALEAKYYDLVRAW